MGYNGCRISLDVCVMLDVCVVLVKETEFKSK